MAGKDLTAIEVQLQTGITVRLLHAVSDVPDDEDAKGVVLRTFNWDEEWRNATLKSIIEIERNGETVFLLHPNGVTSWTPGFKPDDAAKIFWEAMRLAAPQIFKEQTCAL